MDQTGAVECAGKKFSILKGKNNLASCRAGVGFFSRGWRATLGCWIAALQHGTRIAYARSVPIVVSAWPRSCPCVFLHAFYTQTLNYTPSAVDVNCAKCMAAMRKIGVDLCPGKWENGVTEGVDSRRAFFKGKLVWPHVPH